MPDAGKLSKAQAAVQKLHSQLQLVGQPHDFLLAQLSAAEAAASQAQEQLEAAQVCSLTKSELPVYCHISSYGGSLCCVHRLSDSRCCLSVYVKSLSLAREYHGTGCNAVRKLALRRILHALVATATL